MRPLEQRQPLGVVRRCLVPRVVVAVQDAARLALQQLVRDAAALLHLLLREPAEPERQDLPARRRAAVGGWVAAAAVAGGLLRGGGGGSGGVRGSEVAGPGGGGNGGLASGGVAEEGVGVGGDAGGLEGDLAPFLRVETPGAACRSGDRGL